MLRIAALAVVLLLAQYTADVAPAGGSQPHDDVSQAIAEAYASNAMLRSYSFDIHVNVVQRNFPWLHFRLEGAGHYVRGGVYEVHFYEVPGWARGFDHFDLDSIDPRKWSREYAMSVSERRADGVVLTMHSLKKTPLKEAHATLTAPLGLRDVTWTYKYGGNVHLVVTPTTVDGFELPLSDDAEILLPVAHVMAHADFTNYRVESDAVAGASPAP